jgi:hypothetical protein
MSTSPRADGVPTPHVEAAEHVGDEFGDTIKALRETAASVDGLDYLAHYSSGVFNVGIDRLGDPASPADALPGRTRRDELRRLGRTLSLMLSDMDRTLRPARTGGLIRAVFQTQRSAEFCNLVVPGQHVVGSILDHEARTDSPVGLTQVEQVRAADIAMAQLATGLRRRISLASGNPGGWETTDLEAPRGNHHSGGPSVTVRGPLDERTERLREACEGAVDAVGLHLVAHCMRGKVTFAVDQLGDRTLGPFFTQVTVTARRSFYLDFSHRLHSLANKLNKTTTGVLGGLLQRIVLDVEQGAIYYYRLGTGDYLVGVTIDQSQVSQADDRMASLATEARDILASGT